MRDGHWSDRVETPRAMEACLAWGWEGMRGSVAESKASSRRTLGLCLEHKIDLVTRVPRPCALRQALEAWGQQQLALPLVVEKPGRTALDHITVDTYGKKFFPTPPPLHSFAHAPALL